MLIELRGWSGCAEALHAEEDTVLPEPALPPKLDGGLDSDARRRAQHRLAIANGLRGEEFPAGHRYHRRSRTLLGEDGACLHRQGDLRTAGKNGDRALAARRLLQHVGTLGARI